VLSVVNNDGTTETGSLMDDIVREGARRMLAAALWLCPRERESFVDERGRHPEGGQVDVHEFGRHPPLT
jgi:hypothetical protein